LQRKPVNRLGTKNTAEVKEHPWFKNYPWQDLYEKKIQAPFIPKYGDNFDKKYCEAPDKIGVDTKERYDKYIRDENFKYVFHKFTFINIEEPEKPAIVKPTHKAKAKSLDMNQYNYSNYYGQVSNHNTKYIPYKIKEKKLNNAAYDPTKYSLPKSHSKVSLSNGISSFNNNLGSNNDKLNIKKLINSSSSNTLFKNYKQSTNNTNSTGPSISNYLSKRTGSSSNFNY
jgi:hypothetical protein